MLQLVQHADGDAYSSGHLVLSHSGFFSEIRHDFLDFEFSNVPVVPLHYFVCRRITDRGSVPEACVWLMINSICF